MCIKDLLLFVVMRACSNPDRALTKQFLTQSLAIGNQIVWKLDIEFDIADNPGSDRTRTERAKAILVGFALRCNDDAVRQRFTEQRQDSPITA